MPHWGKGLSTCRFEALGTGALLQSACRMLREREVWLIHLFLLPKALTLDVCPQRQSSNSGLDSKTQTKTPRRGD